MNHEIEMPNKDERVASMCSLVGRPNVFLMVTTWGNMWTVTLVAAAHGFPASAHWTAERLQSKSDMQVAKVTKGTTFIEDLVASGAAYE